MTVFYVDPENGNDANAGTSFATRWQTLTSGATTARIAPGDEIRIIASPNPTSLGQTATWTNTSLDVTLTTAVTGDIYQSGAWTAATTNVTLTTSANRKLGASSVSIAVGAAFTTGKAAYLTITNTDFSAYQQVSFWINMTTGSMTADGDITLRLCSDTLGNTTVNTISIPRIRSTGQWQAYTVDLGTALGSNIQSIALYIDVDRGAQTFILNNILAVKASSANDSLSLTSLIGKNTGTEPWLGIQSINGTTVRLAPYGQYNLSVTSLPNGYSGATETVTTWKRQPLILPSALVGIGASDSAFGTINNGTGASPITITGGWNRTDMSTQTGKTYISGVNTNGVGIYNPNSYSNIVFDKINLFNFRQGFSIIAPGITVTADDISLNDTGFTGFGSASAFVSNINITNIRQNITGYLASSTNIRSTINIRHLSSNYTVGFNANQGGNQKITINNLNNNGNGSSTGSGGLILSGTPIYYDITIGDIKYNLGGGGLIFGTGAFNNVTVTGDIIVPNNIDTHGIRVVSSCMNTTIDLTGVNLSTLGSGSYPMAITGFCSNVKVTNGNWSAFSASFGNVYCTVAGADFVIDNPTIVQGFSNINFVNLVNATPSKFSISRPNGNPNLSVNRSNFGGTINANSSIRHTASGISWQLISSGYTNYPNENTFDSRYSLTVATVAVNSGALVTAKIWVYLSSSTNRLRFICPKNQIAGVSTDVYVDANTSTIGSWQELTITFTPSARGAVQLFVQWYNTAGIAPMYIDDFSVTQA